MFYIISYHLSLFKVMVLLKNTVFDNGMASYQVLVLVARRLIVQVASLFSAALYLYVYLAP